MEQLDEAPRGGEGLLLPLAHDRPGDLAREPLLPEVAEDALEVAHVIPVEHVRGGAAGGLVHPHVERRVGAVGEAAVDLVQLQRGDAEVEEDRVGPVQPEVGEHGRHVVADRVDAGEAVAEASEPAGRERERLRVAVDADGAGLRAMLEERLGVAAHAERAVHEDRSLALEGGSEQLDAAPEHDGHVPLGGGTPRLGGVLVGLLVVGGVGHGARPGGCGGSCPRPLVPHRP